MEFEYFFAAVVLFIVTASFIRLFVNGGMHGAKVKRTTGIVEAGKTFGSKHKIKVHQLAEGDSNKAVGLSVQSSGIGQFQVLSLTLSINEAKQLQNLIGEALDDQ